MLVAIRAKLHRRLDWAVVQSQRELFVLRSHAAGSLRSSDAGQQVTLAGWVARRRDHGGVIFIDLRDASGVAQVVFRAPDVLAQAHRLRAEFCVAVTGVVEIRPEGNANPEIATGDIEVNVASLTVLGESRTLAVPTRRARRRGGAAEVPLPGPAPRPARPRQFGCAPRSMRPRVRCWHGHDFVEIETPTLTRSTPEGARDFLVPARLQPGSFYALPQSPQLFKQLLMVAGMERYYQIARCYRDEDFRADRQPEFTQLDMEMSFVDTDDIIAVSEEILRRAVGADRLRDPDPDPADELCRRDEPVRLRQARPALRAGTRRLHRVLLRHPVSGIPGRLRRRGRDARRGVAAAAHARRLAGVGQAARAPGTGLRAGR